ncbi:MAG: hypothetical protein PVSMB5_00950 [Ktedonobacteraceae bacterium]
MLSNIPLGVYFPGESIIHRLQARTKLILLVWLVIVLIIANQRQWHFAPYIVVLCIVFGEVALARIAPREMWQRLWFLVGLALLSACFSIFASYRGSPVLYTLGPWRPLYGDILRICLVCSAIFLALLLSARLPGVRLLWRQKWLKRMRAPMILFLVIVAIFYWFTSGHPLDTPLVVGPMVLTYRSVWVVVASFVVFLALYISSLLLTMTTMPVGLIEGMTLLLAPLRRLKLPVDDFALMTLLALRFIPTLLEEAEQLIKAQTSRGADLMHGSLRERLQSLSMFFLPLVQGTLRRASDLSVALEARGYQSEGERTLLYESSLKLIDYLVLGTTIVLTVASLLL